MALTLQQYVNLQSELEKVRLNGVREIKDQNGETVTYRSDSEIAAALAFVNRKIAELQRGPVYQLQFNTSKGIDNEELCARR